MGAPRKRIWPVFALKMADSLKQGKKRTQIAREMHKKYGLNYGTVVGFLAKNFPRAKTPEEINAFLWQYRETIESRYDVRQRQKEVMARTPPEIRSAIAKKNWQNLTEEQRRKAIAAMREGNRKRTHEERSRAIKKGWRKIPPAERTARAIRGLQRIRPEQKEAISKKLSDKGKEKWEKMSSEEREEKLRKLWKGNISRTTEDRSGVAKAIWERRKTKIFGEIIYVEKLPTLNMLTQKEKDLLFKKHERALNSQIERFKERMDFEDIRGTFYAGFAEALSKWDKKTNLEKLEDDCTKLRLIQYFTKEKEWHVLFDLFPEVMDFKEGKGKINVPRPTE